MPRPVVVMLAALVLLSCLSPALAGAAPGLPGAVCDHQPAAFPTAPAGAVVIDPGVDADLTAKTKASPAGTTFWLGPGTHTLGTDEFGQVTPKDCEIGFGGSWIGAGSQCGPSTCQPPSCPGNTNSDSVVDVSDLLAVINGWGACK